MNTIEISFISIQILKNNLIHKHIMVCIITIHFDDIKKKKN